DPYLASAMAVAYVSAFEKNNIITTPKHFVANVGDGGRDSYPVDYSKRHMLEYDFIPFKSCFDFGKSRSVMTAYNALNGKSCSTNKVLLQQILKDEWKFKGFVISDAGAVGGANVLLNTTKNYTASGKEAIAAGLDVIFQTSVTHEQLFNEPFLSGEMDTAMDKAVTRVLTAKFELGLFDNITEATIPPSHPKDADTLAFEAAVKSLVLLQNNGILPLTQKQKVAVIGTDAIEKRMGGYSGNNNYIVSILDGIKSKSPNVAFSAGPGRGDNFQVIGSEYFIGANNENVKALYYNNISWQGQPVMQFESNLNHHCTFMPPAKNISNTFYSVKWMASLKAPFTGLCNMGLRGNDGYTLSVNGKPHISRTSKISFHNDVKPYNFIKDSLYLIEVTFYESVGDGSVALVWDAF
ncbi:MAG TPA: glycoside hydrolase family 3 N-terminal domain-containing protein, partial [Bacteroidia bacterium]|nr:glycoside hydrolase family 3 N-terminal domain-containing protein [Bacteroidia bacterium]